MNTIRVTNSLEPDQSGDFDKMSGLIWVKTVCKVYQQVTIVGTCKELNKNTYCTVGIHWKEDHSGSVVEW